MRDPEQTPAARAERLGDALRTARRVVARAHATEDAPGPEDVLIALSRLVEGVEGIIGRLTPWQMDDFTTEERDYIATAPDPASEVPELARLQAEDWTLWWALRNHAVRLRLDGLTSHSGHMAIPELHAVIDAFPPAYDELDMYRILRRPMVELQGLSPMRWLILGRPVEDVVAVVKSETGPHPPQP